MKANIGTQDITIVDNLIMDKQLSFIIKKISRLANALFYLSSVLTGNKSVKDKMESMSFNLNNCVAELLKSANNYSVNQGNQQPHRETNPIDWAVISSHLIATINLLNSALIISAISAKNYQVFSEEITGITQRIKESIKHGVAKLNGAKPDHSSEGSTILPKKLFSVGKLNSSGRLLGGSYIKDKANILSSRKYYKRHSILKRGVDERQGGIISGTHVESNMDNLNEMNLNKRQLDILDILSKNDNLSIKDFSSRILDCSEKTIQRELNYLTDQKIIGKSGEKRWTKYHRLTNPQKALNQTTGIPTI